MAYLHPTPSKVYPGLSKQLLRLLVIVLVIVYGACVSAGDGVGGWCLVRLLLSKKSWWFWCWCVGDGAGVYNIQKMMFWERWCWL